MRKPLHNEATKIKHKKLKFIYILIALLKLWLSFFCLSFARARTSASVKQKMAE